MDFVVDCSLPAEIVVGAKGFAALAQEIRTLLATRKGSVPLDRDFGIDWSFLDAPLPEAMPLYIAEAAKKIEKYIPRVQVVSVDFSKTSAAEAAEGVLAPVVSVRIRPEYEAEFLS